MMSGPALPAHTLTFSLMKLDAARTHLRTCRERMNTLYRKPVFDEWAIIAMRGNRAEVLDYEGPRAERFKKSLLDDAALLCEAMEGRQYATGDFEFVQNGDGSSFDAAIKLGEAIYLLCNHTTGSMSELRADPLWREAQKPFVALCEKFLSDPLA